MNIRSTKERGKEDATVIYPEGSEAEGRQVAGALQLAAIADRNVALHANILADDAILANFGAAQYVAEVPNFCSFADFGSVIYVTAFVNAIVAIHKFLKKGYGL